MGRRKTNEEFRKEFEEKYGEEYMVLENYTNTHTKLLFKHNICGKEFYMTPANILHGQQCPHCKNKRLRIKNGISQDEFEKKLQQKYHGEYLVIGEYINANTKILIRHSCGYEYQVAPNKIYNAGRKCPVCANRKIIKGINDIATTHPQLVKYFVNVEDSYKYSYSSSKEVLMECPDCGYQKILRIADLTNKRFSCPKCSDGISYPEKFVFNVLNQLNVKFQYQKSNFEWIPLNTINAPQYYYDFYIEGDNILIEVQGELHYKQSKFEKARSLKFIKKNDEDKKKLAIKNNIKTYLQLDCQKSDMEYIKYEISNSELSNIYDLSQIDWLKCHEYACSSRVKEVCDFWNNGTKDIKIVSNYFKLSCNTIRNYLKHGEDLGWSNYSQWCMREKDYSYIKKSCKPIICIDNNRIFSGCNELARQSESLFGVKLLPGQISMVCNNKSKHHKGYHFKYIKDLIQQERIKYNIDEKLKELEENNV
ncbi:hypothetical protein [Clostridium sardiniense]|uniref:hypothetical protein n=1 Tax=Clostridium sardiniense TaxID=29369 RepID=UPI00195681C7|nr:hypothetical protein [Clostridium sardiniense]MBM7835722.1 putative RNA-binding Zn-ribbon protein involved in translation (DUF1610 family) [Clostridium sardiniense]